MDYFIKQNGDYYEGDRQSPLDTVVTQRPDYTYEWTDGTWVQNTALIPPDVIGFMLAIKTAVGGPVAANALAVKYPNLIPALQLGEWTDAAALIEDAHNSAVLSDDAYALFKTTLATYHIPVTLP